MFTGIFMAINVKYQVEFYVINLYFFSVLLSMKLPTKAPALRGQRINSNRNYTTCSLTSEAVDIMSRVGLRKARLVAVSVNGSDPRFTTSTALSRGDNGVPHTPVCQPPWAAVI